MMSELQEKLILNLTEIEFWIAFSIVSGAGTKETADKLNYSEANVRYYLTKIFNKLLIPEDVEGGKREHMTIVYQHIIRAYGNELIYSDPKRRWVRKPFTAGDIPTKDKEVFKFFYRLIFKREPPPESIP